MEVIVLCSEAVSRLQELLVAPLPLVVFLVVPKVQRRRVSRKRVLEVLEIVLIHLVGLHPLLPHPRHLLSVEVTLLVLDLVQEVVGLEAHQEASLLACQTV